MQIFFASLFHRDWCPHSLDQANSESLLIPDSESIEELASLFPPSLRFILDQPSVPQEHSIILTKRIHRTTLHDLDRARFVGPETEKIGMLPHAHARVTANLLALLPVNLI